MNGFISSLESAYSCWVFGVSWPSAHPLWWWCLPFLSSMILVMFLNCMRAAWVSWGKCRVRAPRKAEKECRCKRKSGGTQLFPPSRRPLPTFSASLWGEKVWLYFHLPALLRLSCANSQLGNLSWLSQIFWAPETHLWGLPGLWPSGILRQIFLWLLSPGIRPRPVAAWPSLAVVCPAQHWVSPKCWKGLCGHSEVSLWGGSSSQNIRKTLSKVLSHVSFWSLQVRIIRLRKWLSHTFHVCRNDDFISYM